MKRNIVMVKNAQGHSIPVEIREPNKSPKVVKIEKAELILEELEAELEKASEKVVEAPKKARKPRAKKSTKKD